MRAVAEKAKGFVPSNAQVLSGWSKPLSSAIEKYSDNKEAFEFGLDSIQRVINILKLTTSEDSLEFFQEAKEEFEGIFNIH